LPTISCNKGNGGTGAVYIEIPAGPTSRDVRIDSITLLSPFLAALVSDMVYQK